MEQSANKKYPLVSIVILNYNGGQDVIECLQSVSRIDYPAYEVILVDNGSTDGSLQCIKKECPSIKIVENARNLGYADGNNTGIRESEASYILLLNDDTIIGKGILKDLIDAIEGEKNIGIAGPAVMYYDIPDRIWSAGAKIGLFGYASHLGKGHKMESCTLPVTVPYICGCAIMIKREVINKIGLLDAEYFAYYEDADYCFRARKAGYRCLYVPSPTVWHKVKAEWITNPVQAYYNMRNPFIFARKNLKGLRRFVFIASQIFLMFPYYSIKLTGKDLKISKALARGLKEGLNYRL